jgi:hypothetical protein
MKSAAKVRILDPGAIYGGASLTLAQAMRATGLRECEIRSSFLLPGEAEHINAVSLQDYILNRRRESVITTRGTIEWLSVRGIDLPETPDWLIKNPSALLRSVLLNEDLWGNTVAHHLCADMRYMEYLDRDFFTVEMLSVTNGWNETAAQWAASSGTLFLIPEQLLTEALVLHEDVLRWNLIDHAAMGPWFEQIPRKFFTPEILFEHYAESYLGKGAPFYNLDSPDFQAVPWMNLDPARWISGLESLHHLKQVKVCVPLNGFIKRVEGLKRIKEKAKINLTN